MGASEEDRPPFVADGNRAERFLHRQLEGGREIVERHCFLIVRDREGDRPPCVFRQQRERWTGCGLAGQRAAESDQDRDRRDGEA